MLTKMKYRYRLLSAIKALSYWPEDAGAILHHDPALKSSPLRIGEVLLYAGLWAMLFYRISHLFYTAGIPFLPRLLSQLARMVTGIEIHPGAKIGPGLFIDHGMGVVIGETAEIGRDVLIFHGVTLGGISDNPGKRHPTVGDRVLIGAGAKILGNIEIGSDSRIGAQAVVLQDVPPFSTAVGIPARCIAALQSEYITASAGL